MTASEFAPAKLNLALHVRARRPDGYHAIETLFAFVNIGDTVSAIPADRLSLRIIGPFAGSLAGNDNLVLDATTMLGEAVGQAPTFALTLDKQLPIASGIGGGSADAAATLRLLARLWRVPPEDHRIAECARALGADVPACLASRTAVGRGVGEALDPVPLGGLDGAPVLLANPGIAVSTAAVFARWDGHDRGALPEGDAAAVLAHGRNDLGPPARTLAPAIGELLDTMTSHHPKVARMSGSGATCFAVFDEAATRDHAAAALRSRFPNYWIAPASLRDRLP